MRKILVGLGFLWIGAAASPVLADPDVITPRALAMGESLRASASGALSTSLNPAGVALTKTYVLEGGYAYRAADHSNIQAVSICDSVTSRVAACLAYDHLSADMTTDGQGERRRHEVGLTTATPLGEALAFGVTWRYVSYTENPPPSMTSRSHDGFLMDAGLAYRLLPSLNLGVAGYNLIGNDDGVYTRGLGFGMAFNPTPSFLIAADGRYDLDRSTGRYGGGLEYLISGGDGQQGVPVRVGYVYDASGKTSYVTGGLGLISTRIAIDLGVRKQVDGVGDELMMQAGLRVFFPNN
jgi:hypothetical protein